MITGNQVLEITNLTLLVSKVMPRGVGSEEEAAQTLPRVSWVQVLAPTTLTTATRRRAAIPSVVAKETSRRMAEILGLASTMYPTMLPMCHAMRCQTSQTNGVSYEVHQNSNLEE